MSDKPSKKNRISPTLDDATQRRRTGLPDPANVVSERELRSPKGARYKVIRTRERDAYDKPEES
ncbi:hypothetical protein NKI31_12680 [Mesorhizobium sp. M0659]|uniref:hypothetical protein n=1 Tax=Mesorhizobium sp. M0659 TaxID=2956980 RepID=UPI0033393336